VKVSPTGGLEVYGAAAPFALILDDTTTANVTYVCKAKVGSSAASSVWQIMRIDETSGLVITWADGDTLFNNIAANRASLSYS
jgi:hypothetical protein